MEQEKKIDESWKENAAQEKEQVNQCGHETLCSCSEGEDCSSKDPENMQVDFISYVTSLGFQTMIFLGLIPNPVTNESEKNLNQAKFLIDTLIMIREKTKGNLDEQEDNILGSSIYELQMRYVELLKQENETASS